MYHLPLTTGLRKKYFGEEWDAKRSQALRLSSFLAPARMMQLLPAGKPLDTFFYMHDATTQCKLLCLAGIKKISNMIVDGYDRVGGLNQKVHAEALDKYQKYCERLIQLISNVLGMQPAVVKKIADHRMIELTPILNKRAEQRGQSAAGPGGGMADTKLAPKDAKKGGGSKAKGGEAGTKGGEAGTKGGEAGTAGEAGSSGVQTHSATAVVRKSALEAPGSAKKSTGEPSGKKLRGDAAITVSGDTGVTQPIRGLENTLSLAEVYCSRSPAAALPHIVPAHLPLTSSSPHRPPLTPTPLAGTARHPLPTDTACNALRSANRCARSLPRRLLPPKRRPRATRRRRRRRRSPKGTKRCSTIRSPSTKTSLLNSRK